MPFEVTINVERCKGCALCISLCPVGIIVQTDSLNSSGAKPVAILQMEKCTGCQRCAIICPDAAIEIYRVKSAPAQGNADASNAGRSGKQGASAHG